MKLVIENEDGGKMEIPLEQGELTIGRDASNHVQLRDRNISRHHCRLFRSDDGLLIEDLQSSNGLAVNGDVMTGRRPVQVGDRIELGDYRILIEDEAVAQLAPRAHAAPPQQVAQTAAPKRKPTPIPRFPSLPKSLEVTPGPPRALAYRQAGATIPTEAQRPAPAAAKPEAPAQAPPGVEADPPGRQASPAAVDDRFTPGPRLAPLPAITPGPAAPHGKTPGPAAPILAITPGPAAAIRVSTPGPAAPVFAGIPTPGAEGDPGSAQTFAETPEERGGSLIHTPGPGSSPAVSASRDAPRLVILSGELAGTSIALPREAAWLGSDPGAELVLPHPSVAPRHCRIEPLTSRGFRIVRASPELELSVNGTSSNEALFRPDDLIRIGSVLLRFVEGGR